jgi:hypothetical protein
MKITSQNRSLVFLAGTLVMGILIICLSLIVESKDIERVEIVNDKAKTNFKSIEYRIDNLKNQSFDPNIYNTIATEIDASFEQELITSSAKSNLVSKLTSVYTDLVYQQADIFLTKNIGTSQEVLSWLNQLKRIGSVNAKTSTYIIQINLYNYYATALPNKVDEFIASGHYTDEVYSQLKDEVQNMPNFSPSYKNNSKFIASRNKLIAKLQKFNSDYYSAGIK